MTSDFQNQSQVFSGKYVDIKILTCEIFLIKIAVILVRWGGTIYCFISLMLCFIYAFRDMF